MLITVKYGQTLRELGPRYAEENNFGNMYIRQKTRQDISSNTPDYEEAQEEELPTDCFCVRDEIDNCPWKENKTGEDN